MTHPLDQNTDNLLAGDNEFFNIIKKFEKSIKGNKNNIEALL